MKSINLGAAGLMASEISLGCMRIRDLTVTEGAKVLDAAITSGINFFDHADIYGLNGSAEEVFAGAVKELGLAREDLIIQTKCGLVRNEEWTANISFDFSKEHIISAVEGSLRRLQTDYVDVLALHRPDALMEPLEVAEAFDNLHKRGLVKYFGVSNQSKGQIKLLQKHTPHKLIVNQLQFGLVHTGMIDFGLNVNMKNPASVDHDGELLNFCRAKDITIQAWSPYRLSGAAGVFMDNPEYAELNTVLGELAEQYGVTKDSVATAWILRHPAGIQVITGSMNPERIKNIAKASDINLTRTEWYKLYMSAGNLLP